MHSRIMYLLSQHVKTGKRASRMRRLFPGSSLKSNEYFNFTHTRLSNFRIAPRPKLGHNRNLCTALPLIFLFFTIQFVHCEVKPGLCYKLSPFGVYLFLKKYQTACQKAIKNYQTKVPIQLNHSKNLIVHA